MKRSVLYLVLSLVTGLTGLSGCVKYVYLPVSTCAVPPPITMPQLLTDTLTSRSSEDDTLKFLLYDFESLYGTARSCITILDSYRSPVSVLPNGKVQ